MSINSYKVVFTLPTTQAGDAFRDVEITRYVTPSKQTNDEKAAAVNMAWHAKQLGLVANIVSSDASDVQPDKFKPVNVAIASSAQKAAQQAAIDAAVTEALAKQAAELKAARRPRVVKRGN